MGNELFDLLMKYWSDEISATNTKSYNTILKMTISMLEKAKQDQVAPQSPSALLAWLKTHNEKQYVLHLSGYAWEKLQKMLEK